MGFEKEAGKPEKEKGVLYCFNKGVVKSHLTQVSISNGLAWNADNTVMYYIDSGPRHVYRFKYCKDTGEICKSYEYN